VNFGEKVLRLCDGPSFLTAWDEIFVNQIYDIGPLDHEPCLVDAGANIGLAAMYWKYRYGNFRYLGFEPDPAVAACCSENLLAWGISGELLQFALGAEEKMMDFVSDGADGGRLVSGANPTSIRVPVKKLSSILPPAVDLLKIDVEGAELDVLEDIAPLLGGVRSLFVEFHATMGRPGLGRAITLLESAGFDCYPQVGAGPAQPFVGRTLRQEFSQKLNLYAVRP
jgi:FkbM family methyltransferase